MGELQAVIQRLMEAEDEAARLVAAARAEAATTLAQARQTAATLAEQSARQAAGEADDVRQASAREAEGERQEQLRQAAVAITAAGGLEPGRRQQVVAAALACVRGWRPPATG